MKKIVIMLLSLFSIITISNAQNQTISGTVTDKSDGSPLSGVTVLVKGTNNATSTDLNGNYSISNVEPNSVLVFSFVGFDTYETQASNSKIDVPLKAKVTLLNEVVVSSLFIERERKELGYSMQELKSKEFEAIKDPNLLNNLSGRVSGVNITQGNSGVGSSSKMYIRGESSLSGDNQPLFVVDGIPVNNYQTPSVTNSSSSGAQEVDYGNGAGEINPDDIESITILKGASAAALYGSRAANGVVLISTKSGGRTKGVSVMVNHTTTFEKLLIEPTFQNQYGQGSKGLWEYEDGMGGGLNDDEDVSWGPALDQGLNLPQFDGPAKGIVDGELVTVRGGDVIARREAANAGHDASITPTPWVSNPDNIKDFFETGVTNQDNVAITAANDNSDYRISYTRLTSEGVIPNNNLNRNTVSLRTGYDLTRKIKINSFISYINSNSTNRPGMGYGSENPMYLFAWYGRQVNTAALKDYWQAGQEGLQQYNYNSAWHDNPYFSMYENTNSFNRDRLLGNIYASYNITNSLSYAIRILKQ